MQVYLCVLYLNLHRAGKSKFSGARKSVLLKATSGEHYNFETRNFVLLVTLLNI